jgi:hypothetical protein
MQVLRHFPEKSDVQRRKRTHKTKPVAPQKNNQPWRNSSGLISFSAVYKKSFKSYRIPEEDMVSRDILISLAAAIINIKENIPQVLVLQDSENPALPFGLFSPEDHRTLESGMKSWVYDSTGLQLDFAEQLYTYGNLYRNPSYEDKGHRLLTISYWAFHYAPQISPQFSARWYDWYNFFPWEDHRQGEPAALQSIRELLEQWIGEAENPKMRQERETKVSTTFGTEEWNPDAVLPRYELLYEAGLVEEAHRDWNHFHEQARDDLPISRLNSQFQLTGTMAQDHRRILASTMGRIRGKMRYKPIIFQALPAEFTLYELQSAAEAFTGVALHKQNFRRALLSGGFVEDTGKISRSRPGRPASLYRFRESVLKESSSTGIALPLAKIHHK